LRSDFSRNQCNLLIFKDYMGIIPWGEWGSNYRTLKPYIEFVRHNDIALQLQPIQNYLETSV